MANQVKVKIVRIGQGDCILVISPGGRYIVVDAGSARMQSSNVTNPVRAYTTTDEVRRSLWGSSGRPGRPISILVMTHSDQDHYNKFRAILQGEQVNRILFSGVARFYKNDEFRQWAYNAANLPRRWTDLTLLVNDQNPAPQTIFSETKDGLEFKLDVLAANYLTAGKTISSEGALAVNTRSIVLKGSYAGRSFLLTGDATDDTENFLLRQNAASRPAYFPVDLVKVGHHGGADSSTQAFVTAAGTPDCEAVISCLPDGTQFKHPQQYIYNRWLARVGDTGEAAHPLCYWNAAGQLVQTQSSKKLWITENNGTVLYGFGQDGTITRSLEQDDDMSDGGPTADDTPDDDDDDDGSSMDLG